MDSFNLARIKDAHMTDNKSTHPKSEEPDREQVSSIGGPGALRGQVWLTVQTRQAQRLISGRNGTAEKPAIIGLVGFADRLRVIWQAARSDDPYADWWLIKVHEGLERAREMVRTERTALDAKIKQLTAFEVAIAQSMKPYRVALQFANPYAYRGAQLIAEYDAFVRTLLTAHHVGMLSSPAMESSLNASARRVRGVFAISQSYHFLGIDRASLIQGTANAARAREIMGGIPGEILDGSRHAPLMPHKVRFPGAAAKHIQLNSVEQPSKATMLSPVNDDDVGT